MSKILEYQEFIVWTALPTLLRAPREQQELAKQLGVDAATLSDWKKRDDFWSSVQTEIQLWSRDRTADVIYALYKRIVTTGDPSAAKLWFQSLAQPVKVADVVTVDPVIPILQGFGIIHNEDS
ncbi:MAG: phBC6A51 family helix-turn-helix protein [Candidatus Saccharimonadia bacterium]